VANYNVDIQLQVQGYKKVQDLNDTVNRLNQETKELQNRLKKGNPFNAAGVTNLNKGLSDGVNKTQQLSKANQKAARVQKNNIENLIKLRKELRRVESDNAARREQESRAASQRARQRTKEADRHVQSLALGVGFPMLFGGGAGSVLGGAAGSFGGFGGQILGSAIGQQLDNFVVKVGELGQALNPATADIDAIVESLGQVGDPTADIIAQMEELRGEEAALEEATARLAGLVGDEGVEALIEFGDATTEFGNALAQITTMVLAQVAKLLAAPTKRFAEGLGGVGLLAQAQNSTDPKMAELREGLKGARMEDTLRIQREMMDLQEQINKDKNKSLQADLSALDVNNADYRISQDKVKLSEMEGNLTNSRIFDLQKSVIFQQARKKLEKESLNDTQKRIIENERDASVNDLILQRKEQINQAEEKLTRGAGRTAKSSAVAGRKAQRDADRAEKERLRSLKSGEKLILGLEKQLAINSSSFEFTKEFAAADFEREALQLRINDLLDEEQRKTAAILADRQAAMAGAGIFADMGDPSEMIGFDQAVVAGQTLQLLEQEEALQKILEKYPMIGEAATAAAGLVTFGVQEMIDGTKSAEQVFADFLNSIADMLLKTAQQMIAQYIAIGIAKMFAGMGSGMSFSDFDGSMSGGNPFTPGGSMPFLLPPGKADGGPVSGGRPYTVGERGPELFVPGASGTIIPNHAMGGANVTVNVDASGSSVEGDGDQAAQLGKMLGAAVQAELIKQKRPGGLLSS